jgi:excinuclease ABC subunit A
MVETGLGYLTLGQPSPTLSGGEAQRLKLVSELANGSPTDPQRTEPKLYILEEPTIGLHLHDVERLLQLLQRLVSLGHTVIVIEHHLDVIAEADFVVEIGPEGGEAGGSVLFSGPPKLLALHPNAPTAPYLKFIFTN